MIPLLIQIAAGFVIGFFLSDKKRGLTNVQFKLGVIIIMMTASFLFVRGGEMTVYMACLLIFYSFVVVGSIFAGEYFHGHIIKLVLDSIHKEDIHSNIRRFVRQVKQLSKGENVSKSVIDFELYRTVTNLRELSQKAQTFKHYELAAQIDDLSHTCVNLLQVGKEMDETMCPIRYEQLADSLLKISWDTLENTEKSIKRDLNNSWNTLAFALRTLI